ncbi:MAG: 5'/3'-nucleotidase SurE [Nitrospiraceae bacterium]|nr:5'/3'-nucleotidase SurE [Nitrospiraceae bacterium]
MTTILVTNDDGIHSPGIIALFNAMKELGDAYVVAPDRERSAVGHMLTLHRPLNVEETKERMYAVNGTPTDCVAIGAIKILPRKPDLIVSGINKGRNIGDDITYSGTVSAAIEGTIMGIKSLAFSVVGDKNFYFDTAAYYAYEIAKHVLKNSLPRDTLLNVNIPNTKKEKIAGTKFTRQGKRVYNNAVHETFDPKGRKHFWIGGGTPEWEDRDDTDIKAVENGYISITPIHLDLTNHEVLGILKKTWPLSERLFTKK